MIESIFDKEQGILKVSIIDELDLDDIINHFNDIAIDESLPDPLKILVDARKQDFLVKPEQLIHSQKPVMAAIANYCQIKEAIIVDSPYQTALATLFEQLTTNPKYKFKIFSTERAAFKWLEIN